VLAPLAFNTTPLPPKQLLPVAAADPFTRTVGRALINTLFSTVVKERPLLVQVMVAM
jgi:hypothetical protein